MRYLCKTGMAWRSRNEHWWYQDIWWLLCNAEGIPWSGSWRKRNNRRYIRCCSSRIHWQRGSLHQLSAGVLAGCISVSHSGRWRRMVRRFPDRGDKSSAWKTSSGICWRMYRSWDTDGTDKDSTWEMVLK